MVTKVKNHRQGRESPEASRLFGRDAERAALRSLLDSPRQSRSSVLVLRGPPGIGKSALIADTVARAEDLRVLQATCVEAESSLPFAGLHQLVRPLLDRLDEIPEPQAGALRSAFGLAPAGGEDSFLVGAGLLSLLADAAEERPLLCVVEDAHWLDSPSAAALMFVARRLDREPIAVLLAARDEDGMLEAEGLPELRVEGLDMEAVSALVAARVDLRIAPSVQELIIDRARGNPLALLELPLALSEEQLQGREPLDELLPLTKSVKEAFRVRAASLPDDCRELLVVASLDETGDPLVVARAAKKLGAGGASLEAAEAAGLLRVSENGLEFRHPLVRCAVYDDSTFAQRQAAHLALAGEERDEDRRAWHLAAATTGPHDDVADQLERSAERARQRGGHASAAAALSRAASLTTDEELRTRRQFEAARAAMQAGQPQVANALIEKARQSVTDAMFRADIDQLRGVIEREHGSPAAACQIFLSAAAEMEGVEVARACSLLLDAAVSAVFGGDTHALLNVCDRVERLRSEPGATSFELAVAESYARFWQSDFTRVSQLVEEVLELTESSDSARRYVWAAICLFYRGDEAAARSLANQGAALARRDGSVSALASALAQVALAEALEGRLASARANAAEGLSLATGAGFETLGGYHRGLLAFVAALLGDREETTAQAEEALDFARTKGRGWEAGLATLALGELELADGRPVEAISHFETLSTPGSLAAQPYLSLVAAPSLIEAAVRAGRSQLATDVLQRFERWVTTTGSVSQWPFLARCRALVQGDERARDNFEEALRLHAKCENSFALARTELAFGAWLRRSGLRREARDHLRTAHQLFEQLGAVLWATQSAAELRASGETLRPRGSLRPVELTPQELQIARFVATGATNKEVAGQLFLSPRTVDAHLRNIFKKLRITSRSQLARLDLGDAAGAQVRKNSAVSPTPD